MECLLEVHSPVNRIRVRKFGPLIHYIRGLHICTVYKPLDHLWRVADKNIKSDQAMRPT